MAITNLYPNLPGHLVEFEDGGLQLTRDTEEAAATQSLLITGTALDGPVMEPVKIDAETVEQLFGSEVDENGYPNGTTLTKYAKQAFKNGFNDVRCMRVTGTQASVEVQKVAEVKKEWVNGDSISVYNPGNNSFSVQLYGPIEGDFPKFHVDTLEITPSQGTEGENNAVAGVANDALIPGTNASDITVDSYQVKKFKIAEETVTVAEGSEAGTYEAELEVSSESPFYSKNDAENAYAGLKVPGTLGAENNVPAGEFSVTIHGTSNTLDASSFRYDSASGKILVTINATDATTFGIDNTTELDIAYDSYDVITIDGTNVSDYSDIAITYPNIAVTKNGIRNQQEGNVISLVDAKIRNVQCSFVSTLTGSLVVVSDGITVNENDGTIEINRSLFPKNTDIPVTFEYELETEVKEGFTLQSTFGGEAYNGQLNGDLSNGLLRIVSLYDAADNSVEVGKRFLFIKPSAKLFGANDKPFYFDSTVVRTVGVLRDELKNYALNNVFEIVTDDDDIPLDDFPAGDYVLSGGTNGINPTNNEMFVALAGERWVQADVDAGNATTQMIGTLKKAGAFQVLENYYVDYIYPAGVYADMKQTVNPKSSFHYELAMLCASLTYRIKMTHGIIDMKPNSNTTMIGVSNYVNKLLEYDPLMYIRDYATGEDLTDENGKKMDIGCYTSCVVGPTPIMISDKLGQYNASPAIAYAAKCAQLSPESSPMNKVVPGVIGLRYAFSQTQRNALIGNHMVVFFTKYEGTSRNSAIPYINNQDTCGNNACDYREMSTFRIVADVIQQIREVSDPFIGEPNTKEQRNALASLVTKRLSLLQENGEILWYSFELNATLTDIIEGKATMELSLTVPITLKTITTRVALRAAA